MTSTFTSFKDRLLAAKEWWLRTPERSLEKAYNAALMIKKIEDEHFEGRKISLDGGYGDSVSGYFQSELQKYLRIAKFRLMEFRASNRMMANASKESGNTSSTTLTTKINPPLNPNYPNEYTLDASQYTLEVEVNHQTPQILEKLKFVDQVLARYKDPTPEPRRPRQRSLETATPRTPAPTAQDNLLYDPKTRPTQPPSTLLNSSQKSGLLPRSIMRTANRFKRELEPDAEQEVIEEFRTSRLRTKRAITFLLLLVIVPLLTQQASKNLIFGPLVDHLKVADKIQTTFSNEAEEKILVDLEHFEGKLRFERLLEEAPALSTEDIEAKVRQKALELASIYKLQTAEPIKNVLADALSLSSFAVLIAIGKRQIAVLKSFIDEVVYGLSDSAKAFVIILFTDVFVGFHSTHGWEVILESTFKHFGLPESRQFIFMFIATFPVMLDSVFKYWIFRYLNQISPSAVATYRNMNE